MSLDSFRNPKPINWRLPAWMRTHRFLIVGLIALGAAAYPWFKMGAMQAQLDAVEVVLEKGAAAHGECVANQNQCVAHYKQCKAELDAK